VLVLKSDLVLVIEIPSECGEAEGWEEGVLDGPEKRTLRFSEGREDQLDSHECRPRWRRTRKEDGRPYRHTTLNCQVLYKTKLLEKRDTPTREPSEELFNLLYLYSKNVQDDLTRAQVSTLRQLVEEELK
jgi:hypothetical protein